MNTLKLIAIVLISLYLIFVHNNKESYITNGQKISRGRRNRLFRNDIRTLELRKHFEDVDIEIIKSFLERLPSEEGVTVDDIINNIKFKSDKERDHVERLLNSLLDQKVSITI